MAYHMNSVQATIKHFVQNLEGKKEMLLVIVVTYCVTDSGVMLEI